MDAVFQPPSFDYRGIPLSVQRQWYKIRDLFLVQNERERNIPLALTLAAKCPHPEAQWLHSVCKGHNIQSMHAARPIFKALWEIDTRARCFSYHMHDYIGCDLLQSAEAGYPFAASSACEFVLGQNRDRYAKMSAASEERDGFYVFGRLVHQIDGSAENKKEAKKYFLLAARLGHVTSMWFLGAHLCDDLDEKWYWTCKHKKRTCILHVQDALESIKSFKSGQKSLNYVVFVIGDYLSRAPMRNTLRAEILPLVNVSIFHHKQQCSICKEAIHAWLVFARRWNICKDLRKLVGKLIWQTRGRVIWADIFDRGQRPR